MSRSFRGQRDPIKELTKRRISREEALKIEELAAGAFFDFVSQLEAFYDELPQYPTINIPEELDPAISISTNGQNGRFGSLPMSSLGYDFWLHQVKDPAQELSQYLGLDHVENIDAEAKLAETDIIDMIYAATGQNNSPFTYKHLEETGKHYFIPKEVVDYILMRNMPVVPGESDHFEERKVKVLDLTEELHYMEHDSGIIVESYFDGQVVIPRLSENAMETLDGVIANLTYGRHTKDEPFDTSNKPGFPEPEGVHTYSGDLKSVHDALRQTTASDRMH